MLIFCDSFYERAQLFFWMSYGAAQIEQYVALRLATQLTSIQCSMFSLDGYM